MIFAFGSQVDMDVADAWSLIDTLQGWGEIAAPLIKRVLRQITRGPLGARVVLELDGQELGLVLSAIVESHSEAPA